MTWPHLFAWYAAMLLVGTLGSYAAYELPGSPAWSAWSNADYPWLVDAARLLVCSLFALFTIWNLRLLEPEERGLMATVLDGWKVAIPLLVPIVSVAITTWVTSHGFVARLRARGYDGPTDFWAIDLPYVPYALYTIALWGGVGAPVLAMLVTRFMNDRRELRGSRETLEKEFRAVEVATADDALMQFQQSQIAMQDYVARLQQHAERYIPVPLTVAVVLLHEQFAPTVTQEAIDIGKVALWLLLGPALIAGLTILASNHQSAVRRAGAAYRALLDRLAATQTDLRSSVLEARAKVLGDSSGGFAVSVLKSTPIFVLLVASLTGWVLGNLQAEKRVTLFVPEKIVELLQAIYR